MTFEELQNELQKSIKEQNRVRKNIIADMITCAKNIAIEQKQKDSITEEIVNTAILTSKKMCQQSIDTCPASRPDRLHAYQICMNYIDELAPKMLDKEIVKAFIAGVIDIEHIEINKGAIMKNIVPRLKGKAEGKVINEAVTELLKEIK